MLKEGNILFFRRVKFLYRCILEHKYMWLMPF